MDSILSELNEEISQGRASRMGKQILPKSFVARVGSRVYSYTLAPWI